MISSAPGSSRIEDCRLVTSCPFWLTATTLSPVREPMASLLECLPLQRRGEVDRKQVDTFPQDDELTALQQGQDGFRAERRVAQHEICAPLDGSLQCFSRA